MTDQLPSVGTDPWAGSPSKPSVPLGPIDPQTQHRLQAEALARAEARDRRRARWYGHYWAVVTALLGLGAAAGLTNGAAGGGLVALLLAGATGWYARYLYRGGRFRFLIIPVPWI